jgi:hypothetical protein
MIAVGATVLVAHGIAGWQGHVTSTQPGHLTVAYPAGSGHPPRELIDISKHKVLEVAQ